MTANATCSVLSVALLLTAVPVGLAHQAEVKSATATLVSRPTSTITLRVENLRDSPLIASEIGLFASQDATSPLSSLPTDNMYAPGGSPIQPHETREIQTRFRSAQGQVPVAARMTMVVFEDGYAEGTAGALEKLVE